MPPESEGQPPDHEHPHEHEHDHESVAELREEIAELQEGMTILTEAIVEVADDHDEEGKELAIDALEAVFAEE